MAKEHYGLFHDFFFFDSCSISLFYSTVFTFHHMLCNAMLDLLFEISIDLTVFSNFMLTVKKQVKKCATYA